MPTRSVGVVFATFLAGLGLGLSLIVAIGAQNAFVLRQGIRGDHVLAVVAVCALSDAILIIVGVAGIGVVIEQFPVAIDIVRYAGAAFLLVYGILAARRAIRPQRLDAAAGNGPASLSAVVLTVVALTWLNPHVYLDTVLLLGSVANAAGAEGRWIFAAGAVTASIAWFTALGFGARALRPLFARPVAWRILDVAVALTMIVIAIRLVLSQ